MPNIRITLKQLIMLSFIYLFWAFPDLQRPCLEINLSVTLLLTAADTPPDRKLCSP